MGRIEDPFLKGLDSITCAGAGKTPISATAIQRMVWAEQNQIRIASGIHEIHRLANTGVPL
jgi:hypothetical protein